ncbi:MAG: ABC transporter substrate-binding protein [Deltaproteobacteria bacterium]|nr:ABC transporter substrate-binding protein [Deltaproteobacteria bacterium]
MKRLLSVVVTVLLLSGGVGFAQQTIKIGGIFDLTGATGDVGAPYAEAARNYVNYVNKHGGVNGKKIELIDVDYAYKIPQAVSAYKEQVSKGVIAILGWGTGDTEAMAPMIAKDKIPYISASYSEHLVFDKTPYNFVAGTTYSDQARLALQWIKDNWKDISKAPRVALLFNDSGFGRSPIQDAEDFAKKIGVEIVDKEIIGLRDLDATTQLLNMQKKNPDFAINQHTIMATATILKDAKKLGLKNKFIGLNWAFSEKLLEMAGDASEGFMAPMPFAFWTETKLKGVQFMHKVRKEMTGKEDVQPVNYTQGFISAYLLVEALKKAGNNLTGENIKKVLETNKFDMMGLSADIAYKPELRKPNLSAKMYIIKNKKIVPLTGLLKY